LQAALFTMQNPKPLAQRLDIRVSRIECGESFFGQPATRLVPQPLSLLAPFGRPAIAFGDGSGLGAMVIRQDASGVTVVGGRIGVDRALALAERA
jgi:hypothetical protein